MQKLQPPRLIAVVVVGLRKFHVRAQAAAVGRELGAVPSIELLELKPRIPGESIADFNARAITPEEGRSARLVIINGRVVKSPVSAADPAPPAELAIDWSEAGELGRKIMERGRAMSGEPSSRMKVRVLEIEGEDLTVEQLGEALKVIGGGEG